MGRNDWIIVLAGAAAVMAVGALAEERPQAEQSTPSTAQAPATEPEASTEPQASQPAAEESTSRQASAQGQGQGAAKGRAAASTAMPVVMMVVPVAVAGDNTTDSAMRDGCWAKLYDNEDYLGDTFTLVGPVDLSNMKGPFGANWEDVSSIKTGPRASVTIYDNRNFEDRVAKIRPAQSIPDLGEDKLGLFEDFRSMRINCAQTATG